MDRIFPEEKIRQIRGKNLVSSRGEEGSYQALRRGGRGGEWECGEAERARQRRGQYGEEGTARRGGEGAARGGGRDEEGRAWRGGESAARREGHCEKNKYSTSNMQ